jgi:hypothetical protein
MIVLCFGLLLVALGFLYLVVHGPEDELTLLAWAGVCYGALFVVLSLGAMLHVSRAILIGAMLMIAGAAIGIMKRWYDGYSLSRVELDDKHAGKPHKSKPKRKHDSGINHSE